MWILTIGFSTIAVLGWTAYFRSGLAVGTEYPIAIPASGAVMIFVSITMACYCLAAHASRKRTFADSAAVFLVLMGFLLGISMFFVLAHAESIHKRQQRAELLGELNSQIKDAQGFFKSR
jgi:hypothetical protein